MLKGKFFLSWSDDGPNYWYLRLNGVAIGEVTCEKFGVNDWRWTVATISGGLGRTFKSRASAIRALLKVLDLPEGLTPQSINSFTKPLEWAREAISHRRSNRRC